MDKAKEVKAGEPCPQCGGELMPDRSQSAEAVIQRHREGAQYPEPHARYREKVLAKEHEAGVLHRCTRCPYEARLQPKGKKAA